MRTLAPVVLVAALLATGCVHERKLSAADHKRCDADARQVGAPGSASYKGVYDGCVHNVLHPERGGG